MKTVTIAVMTYTDGTNTTYSIMRGKLHGRKRHTAYFDSSTADIVGTVANPPKVKRLYGSVMSPDYKEMAIPFGTPEAPAFDWPDMPE